RIFKSCVEIDSSIGGIFKNVHIRNAAGGWRCDRISSAGDEIHFHILASHDDVGIADNSQSRAGGDNRVSAIGHFQTVATPFRRSGGVDVPGGGGGDDRDAG